MKIEPSVIWVIQATVIYGVLMLASGAGYQFYKKKLRSAFTLLSLSATLLLLFVIAWLLGATQIG